MSVEISFDNSRMNTIESDIGAVHGFELFIQVVSGHDLSSLRCTISALWTVELPAGKIKSRLLHG